jgi:DNA-binding MarR family transcriptional regulator
VTSEAQSRTARPASVLESQLCVAVYRAAHAITATYRPLLEPHGLTYPQYVVLLALWEQSPLRVGDLADRTDLDSGTLSPLLRRLETAGWVSKNRSALDGRVVQVELTDRGRALQAELGAAGAQFFACTGMSAPEAGDLVHTLHDVTDRLRDIPPDGPRPPEPDTA